MGVAIAATSNGLGIHDLEEVSFLDQLAAEVLNGSIIFVVDDDPMLRVFFPRWYIHAYADRDWIRKFADTCDGESIRAGHNVSRRVNEDDETAILRHAANLRVLLLASFAVLLTSLSNVLVGNSLYLKRKVVAGRVITLINSETKMGSGYLVLVPTTLSCSGWRSVTVIGSNGTGPVTSSSLNSHSTSLPDGLSHGIGVGVTSFSVTTEGGAGVGGGGP
jgi:hypothetical protein